VVIVFNETVDSSNWRALAGRHVDETVALLDGDGWRSLARRRGVAAFAQDLDTREASTGERRTARTNMARICVPAARSEVFSLISEPARAREWDSTDRGFEWIEVFDERNTVFRNFNKPLLRKIDSVFFRLVRPNHDPGRSLYCARTVISAAAPLGRYSRLSQAIFAWAVRDLDERACELTVLASEPIGFLPKFIQRLVFLPGWRSDLVGIRKRYT
jgi:hypothetical protein